MRCDQCRFWKLGALYQRENERLGDCRFHAPQPFTRSHDSEDFDHEAWWPETGASDWCGEFQPIAPAASVTICGDVGEPTPAQGEDAT